MPLRRGILFNDMVDNKKLAIEKLLKTSVTVLSIAVIGVMALVGKAMFIDSDKAPRSAVEKQLYDAQQALAKNPNDIEARLMLGFTYSQMGEHSDARDEYSLVLKVDPNHTKAIYLLAGSYEKEGKTSKAIETYKRLKDYEPAVYQLGRLYVNQKKYKEAIETLEDAIKKKGHGSDTLYYLGLAYEKSGDRKTAAKHYKEALKFTPDFNIAKKALKRVQ